MEMMDLLAMFDRSRELDGRKADIRRFLDMFLGATQSGVAERFRADLVFTRVTFLQEHWLQGHVEIGVDRKGKFYFRVWASNFGEFQLHRGDSLPKELVDRVWEVLPQVLTKLSQLPEVDTEVRFYQRERWKSSMDPK